METLFGFRLIALSQPAAAPAGHSVVSAKVGGGEPTGVGGGGGAVLEALSFASVPLVTDTTGLRG